MNSLKSKLLLFFNSILLTVIVNSYFLFKLIKSPFVLGCSILVFVGINFCPLLFNNNLLDKKLKKLADGSALLKLFILSTGFSIAFLIVYNFFVIILHKTSPENLHLWIFNSIFVFAFEFIIFWNGMIRFYVFSTQLGVKVRVVGAICGMIPVLHLIVLGRMINIVDDEVLVENNKILINEQRKNDCICKTKYPILMVHGIFFRDFRYFNYWGRIPDELEKNGATIFYGNHQSAASVVSCAEELKNRIEEIIKETGDEKINVIAHSKGGLDIRYAISMLGMDKYIASLTTINTPHRGCEFAEYLLSTKVSQKDQDAIAKTYNTVLKKMGDPNPDFLSGVRDLSAKACASFNEKVIDSPNVYYQSVGSKLNFASSGRFPLNLTYEYVNLFDGANDGLVGEKSFQWGQDYKFITVSGKRGVSHGDMIDLNRENFDGFDVREFFVQLVSDLRKKGF